MTWQAAAWLMLGGSTVLMFLGLPVAFSFLVINLLGAAIFLGGDAGLMQLARNSVASVTSFALTPIPLFILMGEVLFHTGLAVKVIDGVERLIRQVPGRLAVVAVVAGHGVLGDLRLDHRHHGDAGQPDAAGDALARLPPDHGHRADHGDRRGRHADPALGADRAARQPVGHLDLQAADRRHRAGPDPLGHLRRLHHRCA